MDVGQLLDPRLEGFLPQPLNNRLEWDRSGHFFQVYITLQQDSFWVVGRRKTQNKTKNLAIFSCLMKNWRFLRSTWKTIKAQWNNLKLMVLRRDFWKPLVPKKKSPGICSLSCSVRSAPKKCHICCIFTQFSTKNSQFFKKLTLKLQGFWINSRALGKNSRIWRKTQAF